MQPSYPRIRFYTPGSVINAVLSVFIADPVVMGERVTVPALRWGHKERHIMSRRVAGAPDVAIWWRTTRRAARRARGRAREAARLARRRAA